ncbi:MAG: ribosome biogenesis GTPase YlqF [Clostridia bacterium]|nr:ribosome biogenesis GTPase YlqF [Clostridia bacterium]
MENMKDINWFPGHMKKTKELIVANLKLVDLVLEIVDARVPLSSRNPDIDKLVEKKPRLLIVNKVDLCDEEALKKWKEYYKKNNINALFLNSQKGVDKALILKNVRQTIKPILDKEKAQGRKERSIRMMIVGIPNVGKSTFINQLVKKKIATVGNKPGVTRGKQWIKVDENFDLLDTPGVLWPKFEDQVVGIKLACIGTINSDILDLYNLSLALIDILKKNDKYMSLLKTRYKLDDKVNDMEAKDIFNEIGRKRGFIIKGGEIDYKRCSVTIIDEFKNGKIGNVTLDDVPEVKEETKEDKENIKE